MTWVKLDDDFYQHPKVVRVGPLGLALQVAALCYSNHNGTRGHLPYGIVPRLLCLDGIGLAEKTDPARPFSVGHDPDAAEVAGWLVEAGIWIDQGDSYLIHDYDVYQTPPDDLKAKRSEAGRKGAAKRWKTDGKSHEIANGKNMALANPDPDPDPDPSHSLSARARFQQVTGKDASNAMLRQSLEDIDAAHPPECVAAVFELAADKEQPWRYAKRIFDSCLLEGHEPRGRHGTNGRTGEGAVSSRRRGDSAGGVQSRPAARAWK